jgi:hypothetical protein
MPLDVIEWVGRLNPNAKRTKVVDFAVRSSESVDFIIGGDGVRSIVREAILWDKHPAEYE